MAAPDSRPARHRDQARPAIPTYVISHAEPTPAGDDRGIDPDLLDLPLVVRKFPRLLRDEPEAPSPPAIEAKAVVVEPGKRLGGPIRMAAHVALLLAIIVIVLGHGYWSGTTTPAHKGGTDTAGDPRNQPIATAVSLADSIGAMNAALPPSTTMTGYLSQPANPITPVQLNIRTITSKTGDTPSSLAKETGRSVDTVLWANGLSDPSKPLDEGSQIQIPPVDGMLHLVRNGDTLQSIAARYDVPVSAITGYAPNNVQTNADLVPYRMLMVPGGKLPARDHVITYTVQPGDSLAIVAQYFGLQPKTIAWANNLPKGNLIKPGQNLAILPADGVMVKVNANDTVASLAQEYGVKPAAITNYALNGLGGGGQLRAGQQLMIPGGEPPPPAAPQQQASSGDGSSASPNNSGKPFIWPTNGVITQYFGPTDFWMEPAYDGYAHFHQGLDIANNQGTPIVAAAAGTVIFSGWSTAGLGNCVAIDVGNGLVTWFGHMEQPSALSVGQHVNQGQYIGPMGTTGASSGPHTHFAVTKNGVWVNPLNYLPGR